MSRVLVIGCGGVASVAIHKICQVSEVFSDLCIASRTVSKCDKLADELKDKTSTNITTAKVDADNTDEVIALINEFKPFVPAGCSAQCGTPLSGSYDYGCMSCM